jgi:chromosome segregation ATPase
MGYRPQTRSPRNAGRGHQKSQHEKAKARTQKHRAGGKYLPEKQIATVEEVVEKTLGSLNKLGNQIFALSPFSQYFDDWLVNLREVLSEFESSPAISADDQFVKERSQTLVDVEGELAEKRLKEAELAETAKTLSENNHLLVQIDEEYAAKTREIGSKSNSKILRLTQNVQNLEEELDQLKQMKTSFLGAFSKRAKEQKLAIATQKLNSAKSELELTVQNFTVEQEKLHDEYEKKKQAIIEKVQSLEKEVENLETDSSLEARRSACKALVDAVNALIQRKTISPS